MTTKTFIEDFILLILLLLIFLWPIILLIILVLLAVFWSLSITLAISTIYGIWMVIDRHADMRGGRSSNFMRQSCIWSIISNYFPVRLIKTEDLNPNCNYIFGYHPHGRLTIGAGVNFLTEATQFSTLFPGIHPYLMTIRYNFFIPIWRELFLSLGARLVSRESCQYFLDGSSGQGNAIVIVIGGMREIYLSEPETMMFYLKMRKGFIRLALENGASLVPVISFGENEHYRRNASCISNRLLWGRSVVGCLPLRHPITTVVGSPIHVEQIVHPSQTDIDQLHHKYIQAIEQLYITNKGTYGIEHVELQIV